MIPPRNEPTPTTVAPLRCGNCGGTFHEGDAACPWCNAGIALEDRGRSHVCARCATRAPTGAGFCPGCGERLQDQPLAPVAGGARCPACAGDLRERAVGAHRLTECAGCGGLWLASSVLDTLCTAAERAGIAGGSELQGNGPLPKAAVDRVVYRACPACGQLMSRKNHGGSSGVVLDVCRRDGIWLDHAELERVLAWARAGGPERERQRRVERARRAEKPDVRPMLPMLGAPAEEAPAPWTELLSALTRLLR